MITALGYCHKSRAHYTPHERVFLASLREYKPRDVEVFRQHSLGNFGTSYNELVDTMIRGGHRTFAIANDDIVLRPDSFQLLNEDIEICQGEQRHWGVIAARADYVRMSPQNIRFTYGMEQQRTIQNQQELQIIAVPSVAPLLAVYTRETWVDFPPINFYSDDVQCFDIRQRGYEVFVSRSYVHHVGSQTLGVANYEEDAKNSREWLLENRKDFVNLAMQ
jgi:hypothetical protein